MPEHEITIRVKFANRSQEDDGMHNLNVILDSFQKHYKLKHPNTKIEITRNYVSTESEEPEA